MTHINRSTIQARDTKAVSGVQQHLSNVPSIVLLGTSYTPPELVALFQRQLASIDACNTARASLRDAAQAERDLGKHVAKVHRALRHYVINLKGDQATLLADFGLAPPKVPAPRTAEQKALAAERNKATRAARHTMGKKQKKNIKGQVPAATPEPAPHANGVDPTPHA
jgi:hypothetical protein